MNKKNNLIPIISIIIIVIIIVIFLIILSIINNNNNQNVGGDTDKHGCLISAGYSWNDSIGACLREWELDAGQRRAAKLVVAPLSYPVTIIDVQVLRCVGCFIIDLQRNDNRNMFQIKLDNWTYIGDCKDYSYFECPQSCVVCPPCEYCSSISCQTEEFCKSLGFDREWYENITILLDEQ
ncbi:MAG: hypothetical protein ACP5OA_06120 [Candidatus Woesearchaeota archaeon]